MISPGEKKAKAEKKITPDYRPTAWQAKLHASKALHRVACVGRRGGKSEAALHEAVMFADKNPKSRVWWVAPSYDLAEVGWDKFHDAYPPDSETYKTRVLKTIKTAPRTIFFTNGSRIDFRSADKPRSLRGRGVHFLVCDEAGEYPEDVWESHLSPTLLDTGGRVILIGTPVEKNWFYDLYRRGFDPNEPDYESFHATSRDNTALPVAQVEAYLKEKKRNVPAAIYRREYMAEFLEEDSEVFHGVKKCINPALAVVDEGNRWISEAYEPGAEYIIGVDVAVHTDFTVILVIRIEYTQEEPTKRVVYMQRIRKLEFDYQAQRLHDVWIDYNQPSMRIDESGLGVSFVNEVNKHIPPGYVTGVTFTPANKQNHILALAAEIEQGRVILPNIPVLITELLRYGWKKTASGNFQYSAPGKHHDDCVVALCLAVSGAQDTSQLRVLDGSQRIAMLDM